MGERTMIKREKNMMRCEKRGYNKRKKQRYNEKVMVKKNNKTEKAVLKRNTKYITKNTRKEHG